MQPVHLALLKGMTKLSPGEAAIGLLNAATLPSDGIFESAGGALGGIGAFRLAQMSAAKGLLSRVGGGPITAALIGTLVGRTLFGD